MILLPALALSLAFSAPSFADKNGGQCPCMRLQKLSQELDLTADQQAKIKAIKEQAQKDMSANEADMKNIRSQIKELIQSEKIDEDKLNKLIEQKKEIIASAMKTKIMMKNQIYNVLNAQQKAKFSALMDKWESKHKAHDEEMND
ncbi:P pilus assembly/Cpx signaling pathway, periplasmic inhibitor/zinc-resistance associated protein [Legionella oakridgensis ATCC 33761 = DSM 21215]|uniref:P pilus assembly/Cpx signaling pathway, periplasmic inhibitor/zinc-resistance associated protein n=2 Tax=Legionella oakridgensis TaxID=29423 RepID=W0BFR3_9GAMM|nr:Spy/CpxP family protein refolding chaperone [Legionella oakridgensis]AHE67259.1 P pilus assembly/Cpx signaling pathway, periplasmic inhibitor/zinc-resistance associated protein [Legionella oakridgensis ATCC 33761 = DSM 21215]